MAKEKAKHKKPYAKVRLVPEDANSDPIEHACPTTTVCMSELMYCMVSYIAMPAVTNPPGELIYRVISLVASCDSRNSS